VAAFGPICLDKTSKEYGNVTTTPKVAWKDFPLLNTLLDGIKNKKEGMTVAFETDVNAVALFEFLKGGHDDVKENLAYITVGTGIGLGLIVNGKTVHGLVHPEGGHIKVPILKEH
jgi:fructokinase